MITVQIFVNTARFANIAVKKNQNVTTECALKTPIMKTTSALIAVSASALLTNAILVITTENIVAQAAVIWL